ncbi:MAG: helix-turn-helix domain-containing protein [Anaerolineae bacterium]|jgi:transcriptional regulator with XRE-family HTH domain
MPQDLRVIRKRKGMSVEQLASRAGVSAQDVRDYELGRRIIPGDVLERLARALYVEEWDINARSAPPPPPEERVSKRERSAASARERSSQPRPKQKEEPSPQEPAPARETQITHLLQLASHFDISRGALEAEIGKPLDQLTHDEARAWNRRFNELIVEKKETRQPIDRHRAYLPEGVDRFEMEYLNEVQESGDLLTFTLFNGEAVEGSLIGYGPYTITICQPDDTETTINKLAIAYYHRARGSNEPGR